MPRLFPRRRQQPNDAFAYASVAPVAVAAVTEPDFEAQAQFAFNRKDEAPTAATIVDESPSRLSPAASLAPPTPPADVPHATGGEDERVTRFLAALQEITGATKGVDLSTSGLYRLLAEQAANALDADIVLIRIADAGSNGLIVQGVSGVAVHRVAGLLGAFSFAT